MRQNNAAKNIVKNSRFYYGWVIIAISALGYFFSGPGQTYFTSVFIDSYIKDFGWSRSTVSSLYSVSTLIAGLLLFIVGRFADRYGQKKIIIIVAALLGASCMWNSFISSLWMLFLGFFIGRLTGQGSMTLLPATIVPQWFIKKRAFAFSMMSMGGVAGSAFLPPFNTWLIGIWGWAGVWRLWSVLLWFFFIPIVFVFLYDNPEDLELLPDNVPTDDTKDAGVAAFENTAGSWTLKEAMHTRSFWGMLYCQILLPMIVTGVVFHFVSILGTKGLSASFASYVLSLLAVVSFPATLLAGYILDRIKLHHAAALISFLQLAALAVLLFSAPMYAAIAFTVIQGAAMGLQSVCGGVVWPDYYGMNHLGSIRGLAMTAAVIASAVGPIPFGIAFDAFGRYTEAFLIMMIFPAIGVLAALLSPKPIKNTGL
ncbi:putative MFS family arabinose efflux permease [Anaerobacterium chartisolvens]|uniref:Putative MFS family arabinose efflux permease n=1 Tax=Anaerobacterium chartisolvens TaxID=1297424 RepID=A0A369BE81_9FIRM|nr:MFS transporter [Anaerobacterium chartisolvens]RCX18918.1 putative MFS family arabinose efflux permease [Anaerobacterium chartisolvens]